LSGHSKWHNIRLKKGKQDAIRARAFTRASKEIIIAVKAGGPDPNTNLALKNAIERAKEVNMPNDNIKRVIEKASGGGEGTQLEEIIYEGYAPGGVALMVKVATDNRNRSSAEIRSLLIKYGGSLGETGCVMWNFEKKALFQIPKESISEEQLLEIALEAGADDLKSGEEFYEITADPTSFARVKEGLAAKNIQIESAEITYIPQNTVSPSPSEAGKIIKLMEQLEELEDVQGVYANFDIPDEVLEKIA